MIIHYCPLNLPFSPNPYSICLMSNDSYLVYNGGGLTRRWTRRMSLNKWCPCVLLDDLTKIIKIFPDYTLVPLALLVCLVQSYLSCGKKEAPEVQNGWCRWWNSPYEIICQKPQIWMWFLRQSQRKTIFPNIICNEFLIYYISSTEILSKKLIPKTMLWGLTRVKSLLNANTVPKY